MATPVADEYSTYGNLIEHHLRIGDTEFYVPPTSISIHRQMKNKRAQILRARNSLPKESGYFDRVIEITLFFPNMDAINNELRPLLAQTKKCPFLPIENTYLNGVHKIDAITISGVTVQTTPGFPHTLQAQIQCYVFEPGSYMADTEDRTFDEMIDWPLFRWYYQRNLNPETGNMFNTYYEPLYHELDNSFKFRVAAMDDLDAMAMWRKEKKALIKDYLEDQRDHFWGDEYREDQFNLLYDGFYDKAMFEYDLHYEDWDIPGLILTDFSVGFENTITSLQLQDDASPTHQYMGSQDTIMVARFETDNEEAVASLESLLHRGTYLIRNYYKEASNGFIEFDHQLARLFGVHNVTIDDVQTNTIEGQPDAYEITVTMTAYNRIARKLNEVQWLSESAEWEIDKFENQGFWSLITAANPVNWIPDMTDPDYETSDWYKQFTPLYRWSRFALDRPVVEQMWNGLKSFFDGHNRSAANLDDEDIKSIVYEEAIKQFFKGAEVYPDLELPTYGEVENAGFTVPNWNNGLFVEPDFFIKYNKGSLFHEDLMDAIKQDYHTILRDGVGGEAEMQADKILNMNEVTQKEIDNSRSDYDAAVESGQISQDEVVEELVDQGNLSTEAMEALIRDKAEEAGINQNLPLAFARALDEELKQFYSKGTNAKQGKVVNLLDSNPVMMNKDFIYYTNSDGSIDGEYIGVMKVRRMYASNSSMLGKNIEYNVEAGVNKMAEFYKEIERIHAHNSNQRKLYNQDHVYALFDLKNRQGTFDIEKAKFAGVLMMYLGFQKEYMNLVKDNKKPPSKLVSVIKKVLKDTTNRDEWTTQQIQNKTKDLPIKDFREYAEGSSSSMEEPLSGSFENNENEIHKGMMHDMLRYDKRGRLIRAFPSFFMTFIDEGQFIGNIKLSDQYFQYQAVMDIMYTNSRKEASSTLNLEMSNVFGTLDDAEKGMDLTSTSYGEVFKMLTMPGAVAKEAERSRHRNPNYYKSIMLRTGTRIHFRMGYGSNPIEMPTIMNGTITGIQNHVESISVVAQDDGIELTNKIRADVNETTDGGFLSSKKEPTEIVDEILTDSQGFWKNLWAGLSNKEFENHSLGIMHFGSQGQPQGWSQLKSFFGGITGTGLINSDSSVWENIGGVVAGSLTSGPFGALMYGKDAREIQEINMNVYQTTGLTNEEHDKWWNKLKDAFGIGKADEPGINIGLYDKSVWDVLNICASIGDDHIVSVHPFGFRNTIFSGKPYFPLHYDYIVEDETVKGTAVKPFRQFHVYDSTTSILDNTIQTTEENVRTVGVGVYMNEGEMDTTSPLYVDTNIWPEKQRTVNIDTTMNAQGVRLVENIPLVGGLLNKPFKWYFDEGVAIKIAARGLSDYVRDMYDGYLTVMGDPSVKPYDQMWIYDSYNDIVGPADVKEVTQIMNHEVGFITVMKPDAVVVNSDRRSMGFLMGVQNIAGSALIAHSLRKKMQNSKYAGNLPILNSVWAILKDSLSRSNMRMKNSKLTGKFYDRVTGKMVKMTGKVKDEIANRIKTGAKPSDITRWAKNGMMEHAQKVFSGEGKNILPNILSGNKMFRSDALKASKLKGKATNLLTKGGKKLRSLLKGAGSTARLLWGGAHIVSGPVGWIAYAIESLAVHLVASTIGEFIERWLFMRQCCLIAPLQKGGLEFSAGINGHKGSVVGDSPDLWQNLLTNKFSAVMLGFLGVDAWQYRPVESIDDIQTQATSSKSKEINMNALISDLHGKYRPSPQNVADLKDLYETDRQAALDQIGMRLNLLESRNTKAVHEEEETTWEEWVEKIGGWFNNLWDKITDFFGGEDDGSVCVPEGDTSTTGKAVKLSSYFDVIGPKIEREAKSQGLSQYTEILKAKCMQESGGNYKRYPDVMQASESLGKPIGYIKDVDQSIKQGVKYFGQIVKKCNGDIKLALQSYNFGGGFIDYVMDRGGKYTKDLAYQFAEYMVKKLGRRISRIDPGYGDPNYVDNVLRYYDGGLPSGACSNGVTGGASSCPSVTGAKGKKKYHVTNSKVLVNLGNGPWKIVIVSGGGQAKVRPGTKEALKAALEAYGKTVSVTSGWRPGDSAWHGTGWAVDLDTPNTMRTINGKMRFPNGKDKENARTLVRCCIEAGFRAIWFGDWDIVQEMNKTYGDGTMHYDPAGHWNHLHLSYPICKKK